MPGWDEPLPDPDVGLARAIAFGGVASCYMSAIACASQLVNDLSRAEAWRLEQELRSEQQRRELELVLAEYARQNPAPAAPPPSGG